MILIDSRVGSKHYAELLGDKAMLTTLEYGDAAFEGNGITVGIEIKKLLDAVNCMYSGRLADHQIPGLRENYDVSYLLLEGLWRESPESKLLQRYQGELGKWGKWTDVTSGQKRLMYSSFESWLSTLTIMGGMALRVTPAPQETAALLLSLYNWYQREDHGSFHVMQTGDNAALTRPNLKRRLAAQLPGIGWQRSGAVAEYFSTARSMFLSSPEEWTQIDGVGKGIATKIAEALDADT